MENLEQVKEALGDHAQSEAIMTAVSSFIQKEKDIGVESKRKSNSESQGLRTRLKSIQESLVNEGIDFEGDVGEQIKKLNGSGSNEELTSLRKKVGALELTNKDLAGQNTEYKATAEKGKKSTAKSALTTAFAKVGAMNPVDTIARLVDNGDVSVDPSGELVIKNGENVVSFDKGIDNLVSSLEKEGRVILGTTQKGGAEGGSKGGKAPESELNMYELLQRER